ncbi:MAG: 2-oxo-4-hydroxy-4-carboxy-5-ureidoimidazoline decarboxylase [Defluviicoccus sp.]|nr:2-oxo-4-hydroxy-4-carboxy-5-ureidoimidazoline decarboxylase [Defluviicoccus sp.]
MKLAELNEFSREEFTAALGPVFEHSPWIAGEAWAARPFASVEDVFEAMTAAIAAAGDDMKLDLIRAHPDLAGKAARAGALTEHSTREQQGAGLDRLSDEEFERFHRLNAAYRDRFGFPFIVAVRLHTKDSILEAFERRLANDEAAEMEEALRNIGLIGRFRLFDLLQD